MRRGARRRQNSRRIYLPANPPPALRFRTSRAVAPHQLDANGAVAALPSLHFFTECAVCCGGRAVEGDWFVVLPFDDRTVPRDAVKTLVLPLARSGRVQGLIAHPAFHDMGASNSAARRSCQDCPILIVTIAGRGPSLRTARVELGMARPRMRARLLCAEFRAQCAFRTVVSVADAPLC
jgi:hypothetical protein